MSNENLLAPISENQDSPSLYFSHLARANISSNHGCPPDIRLGSGLHLPKLFTITPKDLKTMLCPRPNQPCSSHIFVPFEYYRFIDTGDAVPPVYCGLPPKALERRTFKKVERLGKFNDPRHILLQCEGEMIHSGGDLIGAQAGWAVQFGPATHDTIRGVLEDHGPFGNKGDATRQRATLRAVLAALRGRTWWTDECKSIVIATSDEITVDAAINWLEIWSAAGWETQWENQVKVPVPNRDLWIMLLGECDRYHENGTEISLLLTSKDYNPHLLDLATGYDALRHPQRFFIDVYIDDF